MNLKTIWNNSNKGLLIILSTLIVFSLGSIIFLTYTLLQLNALLKQGGASIGSAFVLQDLLINTQHIESGSRGYALTGDPKFIASFDRYTMYIKKDLATIQSDRISGLDTSMVDRIVELTTDKLEFMNQVVTIRDAGGEAAARDFVESGEGRETMIELQEAINTVASNGLQSIGPRQVQSIANVDRAFLVAGALAVFVLMTCAAVIWYFQKAILRERALENSKSEFLSLASHQLRTPATNVKQYVSMILDGYYGPINDDQRRALDIAYKNNESEISIMNNLLDVAKLDLSRIQLDKQPTNVAALTKIVIADNLSKAEDRQQTISYSGATNAMASIDANYIRGVIDNLVDNAIKYSQTNTKISVAVSRENDEIHISVKDQGLGIRKRDFGKLFNKFSRLTNEFSANSQGSGLGLYWVKQIVSLHHGTIKVTSKEHKGTTFVISLPVRS